MVSRAVRLATMADRFRYAREKRGIGSRELARLAGVNEAYPSQIEGGLRSRIEAGTMTKLAGMLGVTVEWLVDGGDVPEIETYERPANDADDAPQSGEQNTDPGQG